MDANRFDDVTRFLTTLPSRRRFLRGSAAAALGLTAGSLPGRSDAKKRKKKKKRLTCTPNCTGKNCGDDGCGGSCGSCGADQACQGGTCACTCPAGLQRLSNGSCALACENSTQCPTVCICTGANAEGQDLCAVPFTTSDCPQVTQVCDSTADCPRGQNCLSTSCGGANPNRCLSFCAV